jgi:hypothetical protein
MLDKPEKVLDKPGMATIKSQFPMPVDASRLVSIGVDKGGRD